MANLNADAALDVEFTFVGGKCGGNAVVTTLTHVDLHACNTFEHTDTVKLVSVSQRITIGSSIMIPEGAVVSVRIEKE